MSKTKKYMNVSGEVLLDAAKKAADYKLADGVLTIEEIFGCCDTISSKEIITIKNKCHRFLEAVIEIGGLNSDDLKKRLLDRFGLFGYAYYLASDEGGKFPGYKETLYMFIKILGQDDYCQENGIKEMIALRKGELKSLLRLNDDDYNLIADPNVFKPFLHKDIPIHQAVRVAIRYAQLTGKKES